MARDLLNMYGFQTSNFCVKRFIFR